MMPPGPPGSAAPIVGRPARRQGAIGLTAVLLIGPLGAWSYLRGPSTRPATPQPLVESSNPVREDREARGKRLYEEGVGRSEQPVLALLNDGVATPAAVLRCVNCHGEDGRGTVEGGSTAPDITWATLTRPTTRPA